MAAWQTPAGLAHLASNATYALPPHLALLDDHLYQLATGRIKRLMVFMPPRHGKSLLCSQYFPAWFIGKYKKRVILTSYEATFAASWGRLARDVLTEWGEAAFGVRVSQKSSAGDWWELDGAQGRHGVMMTAGVGGAITGKGADLLIIDDPVKNAEEANSPTYREKAWRWYTSTAYTRLQPDAGVLVIQTRWHEDDLSGRILHESQRPDEWRVLSLPAIAEQDEWYAIAGCPPFRRNEGDPLWPAAYDTQALAHIRQDVGDYDWSALYQQHPTPRGGSVFQRAWFDRRYPSYAALPRFTMIIQSIDSAFKEGVANDYSVIATWATDGRDYYLLRVWRDRVAYPDLIDAIRQEAALCVHTFGDLHAILIEDKASGQSALQTLKRSTNLPLIGVHPDGSKVGRAESVSPLAQSGRIVLPEVADWLPDWLDEHVRFPRAAHDDCVDTTSQGLTYLRSRGTLLADLTRRREVAAVYDAQHGYATTQQRHAGLTPPSALVATDTASTPPASVPSETSETSETSPTDFQWPF